MLFDKSVNIEKFKFFIEELRAKYFAHDICLYMDNLSVHISRKVRDRLDELGMAYIYSPIYSPDYNGIESVFSIAKRYIKQRRLKAVMDEEEIDLKKVIREAFDRIDPIKISKCI